MTNSIQLNAMQASADKASSLLRVLANRDRLMLLCQISQGEKCVGELEDLLDIHQPTLSQQLTVLRNQGLVQTRKQGKHIYYQLNSHIAEQIIALLYQHFCQPSA